MTSKNAVADAAVYVVEDEEHVSALIVRTLERSGWKARPAIQRAEVLKALEQGDCAAIILDLGLPGDDGISIARAVRKHSDVPILMLTGRAGIHHRLSGFEAGADDYLVKPFAPEELVARLRALLRRSGGGIERRGVEAAVHLGAGSLDLRRRVLEGPSGTERLTEREARIVLTLARARGPVSREALFRLVMGRAWDPNDRTLDVHMSHVRRKLERALGRPGSIATIRSEGYELRVPASIKTEGT